MFGKRQQQEQNEEIELTQVPHHGQQQKKKMFNMETFTNLANKEVFVGKQQQTSQVQDDFQEAPQVQQQHHQKNSIKNTLAKINNMTIFGQEQRHHHHQEQMEPQNELNEVINSVHLELDGQDPQDPNYQVKVNKIKQRFFSLMDKFDAKEPEMGEEEEEFHFKKPSMKLFKKQVQQELQEQPREKVKQNMFSKMMKELNIKTGEKQNKKVIVM